MKKLVFVFATIVLTSCTSMGDYWTQHGGNGGLTFCANTSMKANISQVWDCAYGRQLSMVWPVADGESVYVVVDDPQDSETSSLACISKLTGLPDKPLFPIGKGTSFSMVLDRRSIILSNGPAITRLNKVDFSKMWEFSLDETENVFQFSSVGGIVFLVSDKGNMYCLDKETGMTRWQQRTDESYFYRWCCSNEDISLVTGYSSEGMMKVMAFDNVTGEYIWHFETEGDAMIPPQLNGNHVIINSTGQISMLDLKTGDLAWSQLVRNTSGLPVKIDKPGCFLENVYYLVNGNMLTGYDVKTGTIIDMVKIPAENQLAGMVASNDSIFLAYFGKDYLFAYSITEKRFVKKFEGERTVIGMGISNGLIVQTIESVLYFK